MLPTYWCYCHPSYTPNPSLRAPPTLSTIYLGSILLLLVLLLLHLFLHLLPLPLVLLEQLLGWGSEPVPPVLVAVAGEGLADRRLVGLGDGPPPTRLGRCTSPKSASFSNIAIQRGSASQRVGRSARGEIMCNLNTGGYTITLQYSEPTLMSTPLNRHVPLLCIHSEPPVPLSHPRYTSTIVRPHMHVPLLCRMRRAVSWSAVACVRGRQCCAPMQKPCSPYNTDISSVSVYIIYYMM